MPVPQERLLTLVDSLGGGHEKSKATIKAQRVTNLIASITETCMGLLNAEHDSPKVGQLRGSLNDGLSELSSIFHGASPTEQKRFIELLQQRDPEEWKIGVSQGYDDTGRELFLVFDTWEKFNKLRVSQTERRDAFGTIEECQIIDRERVLLEVYGVSLANIGRALRKL